MGDEAGDQTSSAFSSKFKAGLAIAGVAAGAALFKGITDALGAEDVAARIEGQLGVTPERASELGGIASGLYRDAWGDSLGEVADAVVAVEQSLGTGLDGAGIDRVTEKALAFADTFDTDVAGAVNAAGELISSGLVADADGAFDLLTAGFQEMPVAIRDELIEASNEYGTFFAQLGLSGEEAFGLLADAGENGVYGIDKTGDALKELTIRSTDMSAASVAAFEAAGLSADDMAAAILEGGPAAREATEAIAEGLLGIEDPVARSNAAIALFGTPLEDLGTEQIPDFLASLADLGGGMIDSAGASEALVETMGSTNSAKLEAFKRKALGGIADVLANQVIPAVEWFVRIVSDNLPLILAVGAGIAAAVVPAFIAWAVAATPAAVATLAAAAPMIALGVAIGALVAGFILAYRNVGWFRAAVDAVVSFMRDTAWPILQDVARVVGQVLVGAFEVASAIVMAHVAVLRTLWRWAQQVWDRTEGFRGFLVSAFTAGVGVARSAIDNFVGAFRTAWRWAQQVWDRTEGLRGFLVGLFVAGVDIGKGAVDDLVGAFRAVWRWVKSAWDRGVDFVSFLQGAFSIGIGVGKRVLEDIKDVFVDVRDAVQWVIDKVESLVSWIGKIDLGILGDAASAVGGLVGKIPGLARGGFLPAGQLAVVGEEGPELVAFGRDARVFSNPDSVAIADRSTGGGSTVVVNNHRSAAGPTEISRGIRMARLSS
jgi:hypothetical protein